MVDWTSRCVHFFTLFLINLQFLNPATAMDTQERKAILEQFRYPFYMKELYTDDELRTFASYYNYYGTPLISQKDLPATYAMVDGIAHRLQEALAEKLKHYAISIAKVHIYSDSSASSPSVLMQKDSGTHVINLNVFISTGYLRMMFGIDDQNWQTLSQSEMNRRWNRMFRYLVGVLAHETAHAVNELDEFKIPDRNSQAIELRTDVEGSLLAQKAGYPIESVYEALNLIFAKQKGEAVSHTEFISTHPQVDLRKSSLRIFLTQNAYRRGIEAGEEYVLPLDTRVLSELAHPNTYTDRTHENATLFNVPNDVDEAFDRLRRFDSLPGHHAVKYRDQRFLIHYIMYRLFHAQGGEIDGKSSPAVLQALLDLMSIHKAHRIYANFWPTYPGMRGLHDADRFLFSYSHQYRLNSSQFLNDGKTKAFIKKFVTRSMDSRIDGGDLYEILDDLRSYGRLLVPHHLWVQMFYKYLSEIGFLSDSSIFLSWELDPPEDSLFLKTRKFDRAFFDGMDFETLGAMVVKLEKTTSAPQTNEFYREWARLAKAGDREAMENLRLHRRFWQLVWDKRAELAAMELLHGKKIDWSQVVRWAEVDVVDIGNAVRKSFLDFISDPQRLHSLTISTRNFDSNRFLLTDRVKPMWPTAGVENVMWDSLKQKGKLSWYLTNQVLRWKDWYPGSFERRYRSLYRTYLPKLQRNGFNIDLVREVHHEIIEQMTGWKAKDFQDPAKRSYAGRFRFPYMRAQLDEVRRSRILTQSDRAKFAESLFWNADETEIFSLREKDWWRLSVSTSIEARLDIYKFLQQSDLVKSPLEYLIRCLMMGNVISGKIDYSDGFKIAHATFSGENRKNDFVWIFLALKDEIIAHIDAVQSSNMTDDEKLKIFNSYTKVMLLLSENESYYPTPMDSLQSGTLRSSRGSEVKKKLLEVYDTFELNLIDKHKIWLALTRSGASYFTDAYFKRHLLEKVVQNPRRIEFVLKSGRIIDVKLQLELAKVAIDHLLKQKYDASAISDRDLYYVVKKLNELVSNDSPEKDKFLERLAWRYQISGVRLKSLIEDSKSTNLKRANPRYVNIGSQFAEYMAHLDVRTRLLMIEYMHAPQNKTPLLEEIRSAIEPALLRVFKGGQIRKNDEETLAEYEDRVNNLSLLLSESMVEFLHLFSLKTNNFEKIPVIEMIMTAGHKAPVKEPGFYDYIINGQNILGYQKGEFHDLILRAFLDSLPEHERTVTLAYVLSLAGQDKKDVAELFKIFQTWGIKFGQLAAIWKIFDDEVTEQLQRLKDDAGGLTKSEIEAILREQFPMVGDKIQVLKLLGTASVKTVVLAKMPDGQEVVFGVRNPHIVNQIRNNLLRSERFIKMLNEYGVVSKSAMFDVIRRGLNESIMDEVSFRTEAERSKSYSKALERVTKSIDLSGWKVSAVHVMDDFLTDEVFAMKLASGVKFQELDGVTQKEVGEIIVRSQLMMLFQEGFFDPDRHQGNILIDKGLRQIHMIDAGQSERFEVSGFLNKNDERLYLAEVLHAFSQKNASAFLQGVLKLANVDQSEIQQLDSARIARDLKDILELDPLSDTDKLVRIVEVLAQNRIVLESKFSFGFLKGLIILYGENYVDGVRFKELLTETIRGLYKSKPLEALKKWSCMDLLTGRAG